LKAIRRYKIPGFWKRSPLSADLKQANKTTLLQLTFTTLPMPSSQKNVFKSNLQNIRVGDEVSVRDKSNSKWIKGKVTSLNPTEVQVDGWPIPMCFKFIRREKKKETARQQMKVYHDKGYGNRADEVPSEFNGFKLCVGEKVSVRSTWIRCSDLPHLLGKQGKRLKRIQKQFKNCEINIIDDKTICFDLDAEMRIDKRNNYYRKYNCGAFDTWGRRYALVQVKSTDSKKADKVFTEVFKFNTEISNWQSRYAAYIYWRRHQHCNDYDSKKETWAHDHGQWYMQKEQHGANGQWFTRKYKNKGRDRRNRKFRKSQKQMQRKNFRKTGKREKSIRAATFRRFSL